MLEALTEEVIQHHDEVHDVTQAAAEELYISLCQQLDGYGQETFMARNEENVEVMLGISVSGVIVGYSGSHKFYPWREIVNVVNHKRNFNIECTDPQQNVGFTLQDAETGRYIWKLCVNQHLFFMNYEQNNASQVNLSLFQNLPDNINDSREDLLSSDDKLYYSSNSHLANSANLGVSSTNPSKWILSSSESLLNTNPMESRTSLQTSAVDVNLPMNSHQQLWNPTGSNASLINRAQSSSCLDLANSTVNINNNINKEKLKSLLPTYRTAPSYETAIQQKYRGSQPEDVGQQQQQQAMYENYAHQPTTATHIQHYPDVTHTSATQMNLPSYTEADYANNLAQRFKMMSINPPPQYPANRLSSTSTPDLALASHRALFGYQTSGSSPDLVSSRTLMQHGFIPSNAHSILYPYTGGMAVPKQRLRHSHSFLPHATYENLNFIETSPANHLFPKHIANNLVYRTASAAAAAQQMEYYLHKQQQRNHSLNALNLSNSHISEPIYENFPLPSHEVKVPADNNGMHHQQHRKVSGAEMRAPRPIHTEPSSMDTMLTNLMMNKYNNNDENISNDSTTTAALAANGNENAKHKQQQQHFVNNGNSSTLGSAASKMSLSHEKDVNLNNVPTSTSTSSLYQTNNVKHRQQQQQQNYNSLANTSGTSSNFTVNTTTTIDTTDSGISTGMGGKKEKRSRIWNILSGGSKKDKMPSSKQKSATLGREKDKSKKDKNRDAKNEGGAGSGESNLRHRWSTGLPKLQPLPSNISKEKLCQLLETKLNDAQLFLEFERIPKRKENAQFTVALSDENRNSNVDRTLLPMDENRVKLIPTRDNRMGYVNASHISVSFLKLKLF